MQLRISERSEKPCLRSFLTGTECFFGQCLLLKSPVTLLPGVSERKSFEAIVIRPNIGLRRAYIVC